MTHPNHRRQPKPMSEKTKLKLPTPKAKHTIGDAMELKQRGYGPLDELERKLAKFDQPKTGDVIPVASNHKST